MALTTMRDWLFPQTIEIVDSPFNGEIKVMKFQGKFNLWSGGAEQSGELVRSLWRNGLLKGFDKNDQKTIKKVLVLGLGAGTILDPLQKILPNISKIIGVEIDPVIIDLGKKYFSLSKSQNLEIAVSDAVSFIKETDERFDLIISDCYKGKNWNEDLTGFKFIDLCLGKLNSEGKLVLNLLDFYFPRETKELISKIKEKHKIKVFKQEYNTLVLIQKAKTD